MRLNVVLCRQNIHRTLKNNWQSSGTRRLPKDNLENFLQSKGIQVVNAMEYVKEKREKIELNIIGPYEKPIPKDMNHPDWKNTPMRTLAQNRVLVEGLTQAQVLSKTVHMSESMPEHIEEAAKKSAPPTVHDQVRRIIMSSFVYDSTQGKLPKIKDPLRPAHIFARVYGLVDVRRNFLLNTKLLDVLEKNSDQSKERLAFHNAKVVATYKMDTDNIQIQSPSDILLTSRTPLKPLTEDVDATNGIELPDMYPMKPTITLTKEHFYDSDTTYPLCSTVKTYHPHTTLLVFNRSRVSNLHETKVTEEQLRGRSLMHTFAVALAYARSLHGEDVGVLPSPVTVQCIQHTDGQFHFGILQLNTLSLNSRDGVKNMWYSLPRMDMFKTCQYEKAIPVLRGYNPQVYDYLSAFYNSR